MVSTTFRIDIWSIKKDYTFWLSTVLFLKRLLQCFTACAATADKMSPKITTRKQNYNVAQWQNLNWSQMVHFSSAHAYKSFHKFSIHKAFERPWITTNWWKIWWDFKKRNGPECASKTFIEIYSFFLCIENKLCFTYNSIYIYNMYKLLQINNHMD